MVRRFKVLGIGLVLGAILSLVVAGPMMPSGMDFINRVWIWASVMGGPILGTAWGMFYFFPWIGLGWLGLLLALAHPARPHPATGVVTLIGLALWFFAGFLGVSVAVWAS